MGHDRGPLLRNRLRQNMVAREQHVADAQADVAGRMAGSVNNVQAVDLLAVR